MKNKIIKKIIKELEKRYLQYNFTIENDKFSEDVFIEVDDKELYFSDDYALCILELTEKYLWKNKIYDVFFTYYNELDRYEENVEIDYSFADLLKNIHEINLILESDNLCLKHDSENIDIIKAAA